MAYNIKYKQVYIIFILIKISVSILHNFLWMIWKPFNNSLTSTQYIDIRNIKGKWMLAKDEQLISAHFDTALIDIC